MASPGLEMWDRSKAGLVSTGALLATAPPRLPLK
jgi:hypothetical protein